MASIATFNPHAFDCTPPKQVVYPSKPSQRHVYPSQAPPSSPTASAPRSAVLWRTPDLARPIKKVKMAPLASTSSVVSQSLSQSDPKVSCPNAHQRSLAHNDKHIDTSSSLYRSSIRLRAFNLQDTHVRSCRIQNASRTTSTAGHAQLG